jgi:maltose phosphorylase
MAKVADQYYKLDPWKIIEEGFDAKRSQVSESIFSLGNEYMGVRGFFEEGGSFDSLIGTYFNGIYENGKRETEGAYKGVVKRTHFMVNSVNWLKCKITLDGEDLDLGVVKFSDFTRVLDLKTGILTREFVWETKTGKQVKLNFTRFLAMETSHQGFQQIEVTPLNFDGEIEIRFALDFSILHFGKDSYWNVVKSGAEGDVTAIIGKTHTTEQRIFSGFILESNCEFKNTAICDDHADRIGKSVILPLKKGETSRVRKYVSNLAEKNPAVTDDELWKMGIECVTGQAAAGWDFALQNSKKFWDHVWDNFDIQIDGDPQNQQGIRYCIFQLNQTYHGQDPHNNIGAKGLTGEAYSGHAFWDTEACCLQFYLFNNPKAAKNLVEYRYSTLPQARLRAKDLDCKGACYPIATLNGNEACTLWQHASTQFQPSTAVAYAIWHYSHLIDDKDFLYGHGAEMLVEICRFLATRGDWGQRSGKFGFYGVMGPDEFQVMVNNNTYTNYMALKTFEYTYKIISQMKAEAPDKYKELALKVNLGDREPDEWKKCADNMEILYDEDTKLFEQHAGYYDLPHIDVDSIPVEDFPLYHNWSYDRIYRNDMIKQPDVLMFLFLYNQQFSPECKKANYDFYEPRTIHESSLSPSIHSILASELQYHDAALNFFGFATRMDLDNYNRNTNEGLHTTSIANAWLNIVYGFGGLRSDGDVLVFNPSIPAGWDGYTFRINYKGAIICVSVKKDSVEFKTLNDKEVTVKVYGNDVTITPAGVTVELPACWRG